MHSAPLDTNEFDGESGPLPSRPVRAAVRKPIMTGMESDAESSSHAVAFTEPPSELLDSRQRREVPMPKPRPRSTRLASSVGAAASPRVMERPVRRDPIVAEPAAPSEASEADSVEESLPSVARAPIVIPKKEPIAVPARESAASPARTSAVRDSADRAPRRAAAKAQPASATASVLTSRRREAIGIALLSLALFVSLATLSLLFGDGHLMGPVGNAVAAAIYSLLGIGTSGPSLLLFVLSIRLLRAQSLKVAPKLLAGSVAVWLVSMMLAHLLAGRFRIAGMPPGGALGEYAAEALLAMLGTAGTVLLLVMGLLLSLTMLTPLTTRELGSKLLSVTLPLLHRTREKLRALFPKKPVDLGPPIAMPGSGRPSSGVPRQVRDYGDDRDAKDPTALPKQSAQAEAVAKDAAPVIIARRPAAKPSDDPAPASNLHNEPTQLLREEPTKASLAAAVVTVSAQSAERVDATEKMDGPPAHMPLPDDEVALVDEPSIVEQAAPIHHSEPSEALAAVTPRRSERRPGEQANYIKLRPYEPPPIDLFDFAEHPQHELDRKAMLDLAQRLEGTLGDYLVKGRVTAIHPGPVVTMYEFVPAPGIKLARITSLSSDLAMALEALRVRIVAPIPGKAAVGIEVPNRTRETVYLKEVLADDSFRSAKSKLTMAIGKDIAGLPVSVDLAKMPHLLVAGTTGSGKSVSVNTMVCSLLMNASPDEVKMIMIDPKMLELSIYEGIPHLLLPVVTDPKKAALALRWAVEEMDRRYDLISKSGVRDIGGFNKKVEKSLELMSPTEQLSLGVDLDDISRPHPSDPTQKLPYIVVLIDEFADLMMVAGKEVEICVARIAQKARAAGIHLILATQRPSVDVITGLIKANFPSRIAFQVASRVDSRTILDAQGAENLLGMGDMLFTDRGQALRRIHGALITDGEVHRVVEHLKQLGKPIYDMDILKPRGDEEEEGGEDEVVDELYDQAIRVVSEGRQISISMLQRKMRIGYNRSARMIEKMERDGIVGPADGAKGVREVFVHNH